MLQKMRDVLGKITKASVVDEKLVKEIVRDIQRVMISSDMNIKLVQQLSKDIENAALKQELPPGVSRKEHIIKLIYDEFVKILGAEHYIPKMEPHRILLVGLYGSGKTTSMGKLAKFYTKRGLKTCLITTDTYRPAAYEQLKQLGDQINVPVFGDPDGKDAIKILEKVIPEVINYDLIIIDSAGRDSLNDELTTEIKEINNMLKPQEKFLVISADIGQTAIKQAEQFNEAIGLTGVIATKADTSGKAGGALSACYAANVPVAFIGTGEKVDDFEIFEAERFVSRLLGFPDLGSLMKKMKDAVEETDFSPEDVLKGDYNLKTFYKQLEATKKMGPLKKVFEMMGMGQLPTELMETSEEKMKKFKHIMDSMTEEELENPDLIKAARVKRIAKGSGTTEGEVKELLKQFETGKKMIKKLKKGKGKNFQQMIKKMQGGQFKM